MHPNVVLARLEMEAALAGDVEAMLTYYAGDVVLHYPGRNALSGIYAGKDGVRSWMAKIEQVPMDRSPSASTTCSPATIMQCNSY